MLAHQVNDFSEHTAKPGAEGHFNAEVIYKTEEEADEYLKSLNNEEVVLFFTDFHFPLSQRKFVVHHRGSNGRFARHIRASHSRVTFARKDYPG